MNFSKNHKFCKVLSLILVLILMSTLFAGCKKEDSEPQNTSGSGLNLNLNNEETTPPTTQTEPVPTEPVVVNEKMGTVTSQMNVRVTPSTDATVVGTLYAGDRVEVTRQETVVGINWGYISDPVGWIVMEYVAMDVPSSINEPDTSTPASTAPANEGSTENNTTTNTTNIKGVITGNGVNIRSEGSTNGKIVGSYSKGDVVTILETSNGWGRTSQGWVKMDYVNTSGTTTNTNNNTTNNNTTNNTNTTTNNNTTITSNGNTTVVAKGIVIAKELNVRSNASQDSDRVGSLTYGARVEILETSGNWGRTKDGWIHMGYIYKDGTTGTNTATGVVTAEGGLNIRSGPGTGYGSVGSYAEGDTVNILEQFTYNGVKWGCTSKGWISMNYVDVDGSDDDDTDNDYYDDDDDSDYDERLYGTVTAEGGLRIRSGAGSNYNVVGSLSYGEDVVILDRKEVDDTTWGKISEGWICLDYVDLD